MLIQRKAILTLGACACVAGAAMAQEERAWAPAKPDGALRVATFNVWDVGRTRGNPERARRLGEVIHALHADVLLINEIAVEPDGSSFYAESFSLQNRRGYQDDPARYDFFSATVNTGVHSGFDLNNDGKIVKEPGSREYGEDCFGYGEYPGQYGMALFVDERIGAIDRANVRTFQKFLWKDMPGAMIPEGWYSDEELAVFRLSSKSHWDVPVRLKDGTVVHILASHPTPPVFDGPEDRNGRRNHDEIRFWADYIGGGEGASYIVDDRGGRGGLAEDALFVIVGDLNADPKDGNGVEGAIARLLDHPRVRNVEPVATGERATIEKRPDGSALRTKVEPTDTALFGLRADYALPSVGFEVVGSGMVREESPEMRALGARFPSDPWWIQMFPSDHFPVYVDVRIPKKD
jgi:3-phytase